MINPAIYSSATDQWPTPQSFFNAYDRAFRFTLDVCADASNAKCVRYFDRVADGLSQSWAGEIVWCNPPYGREIGRWVAKAREESERGAALVVCLLPARTDTAWWHDHVQHHAQVTFVRGRLRFGDAKTGAPFPSAVAIYFPRNMRAAA